MKSENGPRYEPEFLAYSIKKALLKISELVEDQQGIPASDIGTLVGLVGELFEELTEPEEEYDSLDDYLASYPHLEMWFEAEQQYYRERQRLKEWKEENLVVQTN